MSFAKLALLGAVALSGARAADYTALDRYVAAPDPSYRYSLNRTLTYPGLTAYQIDLVSQTWLTSAEVSRPEWHHWLTVYKPDHVASTTALLIVNGGSNTNTPSAPDPTTLLLAASAGTVVVEIDQVPNEPLRFTGETRDRTEDAIIAYSWDKFLRTGDERWPVRLPMTKATVRAMDTTTAFLSGLGDAAVTVKNFVLTGGSKRGWTAWSTAAVDPRVIAIAPIVIDTLDVDQVFGHTWQAYGFWPPAVQDYVAAGIMNWFGTPQMQSLLEIEDPYQYRDRLALPTYSMCATGDQFFVPDSPRYYFSDLGGEKYLRFVPNTDHGMASLEAMSNLLAWSRAVVGNFPRPRFSWKVDRAAGTLSVRAVDTPTQVKLWQASNPKARDFRLETIGAAWTSTPVPGTNNIYRVAMPTPDQGWTAFFLELTFPGPDDIPLVFTTEVVVLPDVYPFPSPWAGPPQ